MDYWKECISEALDECGIEATSEQIAHVADAVRVSHENYGMSYGYDAIPNPLRTEIDRLKKELADEKDLVFCEPCRGKGWITENFGMRSSTSQCDKCRGRGKHK